MEQHDIEALRARLADLEQRVTRDGLAGMPLAVAGGSDDMAITVKAEGDQHEDDQSTSRRHLLRNVALAAGGAVVATVVASNDPVAALALSTGGINTESNQLTDVNYTGAVNGTAFLFQAGSAFLSSDSAGTFPSALGGWTSLGAKPHGVYGFSSASTGSGVVGLANGVDGVGVLARGPSGLVATATGGTGTAVEGNASDGYGARGTSNTNIGVVGNSNSNVGVFGAGTTGVRGDGGTSHGVHGVSVSGNGVYGTGPVGISGDGSKYALVANSANTAALLLSSAPFGAGAVRTPPPTRVDVHKVGEIDVDSHGDLWFCVADGTPGGWRKLSGASTAGAFHPLTPGRVYDSRVAAPGPSATLAAGTTRLVSVAARRDLTSGAIIQTDFVPAGATAITANVTVANTVSGGFLTVNPGGTVTVNAATINWSASGQILNNGVTLTLNASRELTVIAGGSAGAATDFVIDVNGYYL